MAKTFALLAVAFLAAIAIPPWAAAEDDPNTTCYYFTQGDPVAHPFPCTRPICVHQLEVCTTIVDEVYRVVGGIGQGGGVVLPPGGLKCTVEVLPSPSVSCTTPNPLATCSQTTAAATVTGGDAGSFVTVTSACEGFPPAQCTAYGPNGSCSQTTTGSGRLPWVCRWAHSGTASGHYTVACSYAK